MPELTYRYSERHFKRYEAHIATIVRQWPAVSVFDPTTLSLETFSCRLRDAMKSLHDNQWTSSVDAMKFVQIADDITVSTSSHPGKVAVGPRDKLRKLVPLGRSVEAEPAPQTLTVPAINLINPPVDTIIATLVFHRDRILVEPSVIETPEDLIALGGGYDVEIEKTAENKYTIY